MIIFLFIPLGAFSLVIDPLSVLFSATVKLLLNFNFILC